MKCFDKCSSSDSSSDDDDDDDERIGSWKPERDDLYIDVLNDSR
jgi:hypothetical protein